MSETSLLNSPASAEDAGTPETAVRDRRMRWFEVVVVTSVAFLTPLLGSIHALIVKRCTPAVVSQFGFSVGSMMLLPPLLTLTYVL
jgi:membrane protease YdiL (CAAX protease family)